jgi:hypothetical protein
MVVASSACSDNGGGSGSRGRLHQIAQNGNLMFDSILKDRLFKRIFSLSRYWQVICRCNECEQSKAMDCAVEGFSDEAGDLSHDLASRGSGFFVGGG